MAGDSNKEGVFSKLVDRIVNGEDVTVGPEESDEVKDALEFARTLAALRSEPSPLFKADLEGRLLRRLAASEQRVSWFRKWWESGPSVRWVSLAATAAVIVMAVVVFLSSKGVFSPPPSPSAPATPPAPTVPSSPVPPSPSAPTAPATSPAVPSQPSAQPPGYAYSFDNLSDLTAFSDSIAVAVVDKAIAVNQQGNGLYTTQWALRVEGLLKGPQLSQLIISQTGSPDVPGSAVAGDPLFRPGETYLLFLKEGAQFSYFGPFGRYLISNGKVYSMNHVVDDGGYKAPSELDLAGRDFNTVVSDVSRLNDSVQLTFALGETRLPADVLRYPAGTTLTVDARLSSGTHGPSGVTMTVDKSGIPAGLGISLDPAVFVADPRSVSTSSLIITIDPDLPAGDYEIPVEYIFEGLPPGRRVITLHVEQR